MCMGSRIKSERVCLMFPYMPGDRRIRRGETERKTVPGFPAAAVVPGTSSGRAGNKKSRTRPSIISDRTSCQAEFPAALQNFRVLPRSCFLKSVTPAVRYFRRCIGLCPKIEQPLPFSPCPIHITLMSIGGIADAAFPRGPCHGIMTASTLHAILSWFPRVFFQDRFPGI